MAQSIYTSSYGQMSVHSEIKEVTDYFVRSLINKAPRFKVNCFAQELANSLLVLCVNGEPIETKDLLKNADGYWVFRQANYVCPLLMDVLNKCAIAPVELLSLISETVYFKIGQDSVSSICGTESKVINLMPFKKNYFEVPLRVLKFAVQQRTNMLVYRHTFDGGYPNNFIPLIRVNPEIIGKTEISSHDGAIFRAVGLQMFNYTGSHNAVQPGDLNLYGPGVGPTGDSIRSSFFSECEKTDFFSPGWWERIVVSQIVGDYAEQSKYNVSLRNILNSI